MKREATRSKSNSSTSSRRHRYTKVTDARKHAVRGLWRRNGSYFARLTVEADSGQKRVKWVPLESATSDAEAIAEFRKLLVERDENRLRPIGLSPLLKDYAQVYLARQETSGKRPDTLVTETGHINKWVKAIGGLRLDKIRAHHITNHLHDLRKAMKSARTCNLALVCLRNVFRSAKVDGHLKSNPAEGIPWFKTEKPAHRLYGPAEVDRLCLSALENRFAEGRVVKHGEPGSPLRNGVAFVDYVRFLQYTGAREQEALRVRWEDVNTEQGFVMIGAQGDSKNREARAVDFNPPLRTLIEAMRQRRAPDSQWLFPSPQRGDRDEHARTFRESLLLAREAAGLPGFGFHDLRRHFASRAIMSGIDVLTVSRWLGHKDGGLLLLKSYAHLASEHRKAQAARLVFNPTPLPDAAASQ